VKPDFSYRKSMPWMHKPSLHISIQQDLLERQEKTKPHNKEKILHMWDMQLDQEPSEEDPPNHEPIKQHNELTINPPITVGKIVYTSLKSREAIVLCENNGNAVNVCTTNLFSGNKKEHQFSYKGDCVVLCKEKELTYPEDKEAKKKRKAAELAAQGAEDPDLTDEEFPDTSEGTKSKSKKKKVEQIPVCSAMRDIIYKLQKEEALAEKEAKAIEEKLLAKQQSKSEKDELVEEEQPSKSKPSTQKKLGGKIPPPPSSSSTKDGPSSGSIGRKAGARQLRDK